MFTYLFDGFLRRVFSLLRADVLYIIYSSGLKVWVLLVQNTFRLPPVISVVVSVYLITSTTVLQIPVLVLRPEFGARFAPSVHDDLCSQTDFLYPYFRWRKKLPFPPSGQSFSFYLLPSLVRRFFGTTISLTQSQNAHICWLSFWPGFITWGIDLDSSF